MLSYSPEFRTPSILEAPDFDTNKALDLRKSADRLETLIAKSGPSWLSHDELHSIAAAEGEAGRKISLYLSTRNMDGAAALRADIEAAQRQLGLHGECKISGLLESEGAHFVAAHGLIKKDRAAIVVVDSKESATWSVEPAEHIRRSATTTLHWILSGTQKDSSSCATFSIAALRAIDANAKRFDTYLREALPPDEDCEFSEIEAGHEPSESEYVIFGDSSEEDSASNHSAPCEIVKGEDVLPPDFYRYAQSRKTVERYCAASPYVRENPELGSELSKFHEQHRRATVVSTFPITSNCAIIDLQAQLLRKAADYDERSATSPGTL